MREICSCFLWKKNPSTVSVSRNHLFCILPHPTASWSPLSLKNYICLSIFILQECFFFASLFLGFYFLFTSAFNFGPMFTLASDRATRDRSFLMLRTHHEAKIPTTNHIWLEIFKWSLGSILWKVWFLTYNFISYQMQKLTCNLYRMYSNKNKAWKEGASYRYWNLWCICVASIVTLLCEFNPLKEASTNPST